MKRDRRERLLNIGDAVHTKRLIATKDCRSLARSLVHIPSGQGTLFVGLLLRHAERIITKHFHVRIHRNEGIRLGKTLDVCAEGFIDLLALLG
jgi:hypothetical protein